MEEAPPPASKALAAESWGGDLHPTMTFVYVRNQSKKLGLHFFWDNCSSRDTSELRIQMAAKRLERIHSRFLLGAQNHRLQGLQSVAEQMALVGKRNVLL